MKTKNTTLRISRFIYLLFATVFALCVFIQIYIAGVGIFLDASAWTKHITFVHIFGYNLPIFMLIFAIVGRVPYTVYLQLFGIFVSIFLMYFTANFTSVMPLIGPMHVIMAIVLLVLSCFTVKNAWKIIIAQSKMEEDN